MIYRESTGAIEVFAPDKSRRLILAHVFSNVFLQNKHIIHRTYNLQPLLNPSLLTWDSVDGIESITVVKLSLQNSEWDSQLHIDLAPMQNGECDIHQYLSTYLKHGNPLSSGMFVPIKVRIVIDFHGDSTGQRKVLPISLCLPNQCDLRCRTEDERLLGEKYLRRWGVLCE